MVSCAEHVGDRAIPVGDLDRRALVIRVIEALAARGGCCSISRSAINFECAADETT
jgi:hypothetical protein